MGWLGLSPAGGDGLGGFGSALGTSGRIFGGGSTFGISGRTLGGGSTLGISGRTLGGGSAFGTSGRTFGGGSTFGVAGGPLGGSTLGAGGVFTGGFVSVFGTAGLSGIGNRGSVLGLTFGTAGGSLPDALGWTFKPGGEVFGVAGPESFLVAASAIGTSTIGDLDRFTIEDRALFSTSVFGFVF